MLPSMDTPSETPRIEPETDQGRAFLAAYRATDDAGRVLIWCALLTELDRRPDPPADAGPPQP